MASVYTDGYKAEALATLVAHRGNVKTAAQSLGIPRTTLINWRDKADSPLVLDTIPLDTRLQRIELWDKGQALGVQRLLELIPLSDSVRDVAYATDRLLAGYLDLTEGRKGMTTTINGDKVLVVLE